MNLQELKITEDFLKNIDNIEPTNPLYSHLLKTLIILFYAEYEYIAKKLSKDTCINIILKILRTKFSISEEDLQKFNLKDNIQKRCHRLILESYKKKLEEREKFCIENVLNFRHKAAHDPFCQITLSFEEIKVAIKLIDKFLLELRRVKNGKKPSGKGAS